MATIPEFTDSELWLVRETLEERYRKPVTPDSAEAELRLDPFSSELTLCPTLFWQDDAGANFAIFKVGERRYRSMFYYNIREQYGTGVDEYDDLTECVVTLLQVQADHEAKKTEKKGKDNG